MIIDDSNKTQRKNIDLLFEGYWHSEMPTILEIDNLKYGLREVMKNIDGDKYSDFVKTGNLITKYNSIKSPEYIYSGGIEPIVYFEFKKNGDLREMQLPNVKYYCTFIYNTIAEYDVIFNKLYQDNNLRSYVSNSDSPIMLENCFNTKKNYDDYVTSMKQHVFAVTDNKRNRNISFKKKGAKYLQKQNEKLYMLKVDIESFFSNVYTHYLARMKNWEPFKSIEGDEGYFDFLDTYNRRINSNQTKGIATGVFSSQLSAEMLMLCIDYEIRQQLEQENLIEYTRYVDDMTFYSDSLDDIKSKLPLIQQILNKYKLRINSSKTESRECVYASSYVDMYSVDQKFPFLKYCEKIEEKTLLDEKLYYYIKNNITKSCKENQLSEVRAILTKFATAIDNDKITFKVNSQTDWQITFVKYMLQLACSQTYLAFRCYKVIIAILKSVRRGDRRQRIIQEIKVKSNYINNRYPDTILQLWHYYTLNVYDEYIDIQTLEDEFKDSDINPLIVAMFVEDGDNKNEQIFKYIVRKYRDSLTTDAKKEEWKKTIMFSKWWLPLFLIRMKDKNNYEKFYTSNHFHKIYRDLLTPVDTTVQVSVRDLQQNNEVQNTNRQ